MPPSYSKSVALPNFMYTSFMKVPEPPPTSSSFWSPSGFVVFANAPKVAEMPSGTRVRS